MPVTIAGTLETENTRSPQRCIRITGTPGEIERVGSVISKAGRLGAAYYGPDSERVCSMTFDNIDARDAALVQVAETLAESGIAVDRTARGETA